MFFRNRKKRKQAKDILDLLETAIREVHPDRFVIPEDAGFVLQPKIVGINTMIKRDPEERFFSIDYENVLLAAQKYENAGLSQTMMDLMASTADFVGGAIFAACHHENRIRNRKENYDDVNQGREIKELAVQLIEFVNRGASNKREPKRG